MGEEAGCVQLSSEEGQLRKQGHPNSLVDQRGISLSWKTALSWKSEAGAGLQRDKLFLTLAALRLGRH